MWRRELPSLGPAKSSKSCKLSLQPEPETSGGSNQSSCKSPKQGKRLQYMSMEKLEFRKLVYAIFSGQVANDKFNQYVNYEILWIFYMPSNQSSAQPKTETKIWLSGYVQAVQGTSRFIKITGVAGVRSRRWHALKSSTVSGCPVKASNSTLSFWGQWHPMTAS